MTAGFGSSVVWVPVTVPVVTFVVAAVWVVVLSVVVISSAAERSTSFVSSGKEIPAISTSQLMLTLG